MVNHTIQTVLEVMRRAIEYTSIPDRDKDNLYSLLSECEMSLSFQLRIKRGDKLLTFKAYRALHSSLLGPYKGGIRIDKNLSLEESMGLAMLMTIKNALFDIPFGGSKGGVKADVDSLTKQEKEHLLREYMRKLANYIDERTDIPGPDVNTTEFDMNILFDEYSRLKGKNVYSIVTGKSTQFMGIEFRRKSTGYGAAYLLDEVLEGNRSLRIGIQGFGNVGSNMFRKLSEMGYKVYGVSDSKGGVYSEMGLDFIKLERIKRDGLSVREMCKFDSSIKDVEVEEFIGVDVDVLVLAATENALRNDNVNKVKAKIVFEVANSPITEEADKTLREKNTIIIPDIVANTGGVYASYYEWLKGNGIQNITDEYVEESLREKIVSVYRTVKELSKKKGISLREAAFALAMEKLYSAGKLRGII